MKATVKGRFEATRPRPPPLSTSPPRRRPPPQGLRHRGRLRQRALPQGPHPHPREARRLPHRPQATQPGCALPVHELGARARQARQPHLHPLHHLRHGQPPPPAVPPSRTALDCSVTFDPANKVNFSHALGSGGCRVKYTYSHGAERLTTIEPLFDTKKNAWEFALTRNFREATPSRAPTTPPTKLLGPRVEQRLQGRRILPRFAFHSTCYYYCLPWTLYILLLLLPIYPA
ncbi:hypothetical protein HU200_066592 [Digitaria exilis]|uniref:Uncharacterized protein n=1 Tax=Digitaria exilis TaxID=1010633 RepID=A0A834ZWV5_9POAL|nr:hypothetical protein HU200_066592 [Digitaria exilis]